MITQDRLEGLLDARTWIEALDHAMSHDARVESLAIDSIERGANGQFRLGLIGSLARGGRPVGAAWSVTAVADLKEFARCVRDVRSQRPVKPAVGPAFVVVPERSAVIVAFPNDAGMPRLRTLARPARLRMLLALAGDAAGSRRSTPALTPLRYRPESRFTGRLSTPDGKHVIVRASSDRSAANRAAVLVRASATLPFVPRPLGVDEDSNVFLEEHRSGALLAERLNRHDVGPIVAETGRRLRLFHGVDIGGLPDIPVQDDAALFASLDDAVGEIEALDSDAHALARDVRAKIADAWPSAPERPPVLCHGAFDANAVRFNSDGPVLLGPDDACIADPHRDVGRFLAGIALAEIDGRVDRTAPPILRAAFVEGAGTRLVPALRFEAVALLELATRPFARQRPNWRAEMTRLLERARACVDQRP